MYSTIDEAIAAIKSGKMIIVSDNENRENEGDLIMAAEMVTPEAVNFMTKHARGLVCVPITQSRAAELCLNDMGMTKDRFQTAFSISVDYKHGTTTGISVFDRAKTIAALVDENATTDDFYMPGHVFPLIAQNGGVLKRNGHTEATIDLTVLAGLKPAGVICEILNDDGSMARGKDLEVFAKKHDLIWITIKDLIQWFADNDKKPVYESAAKIKASGSVAIPSRYADEDFQLHCYTSQDAKEHVALIYGDIKSGKNILTRIHSECLTGDVFHSARCDCGEQLDFSMEQIVKEGQGVIVYLRQEGRGIGLINKIRAYKLQDDGLDTVDANVELGFPADMRDYDIAAEILQDLNIKSVRLMTNNPEKIDSLNENGIKVTERIAVAIPSREENEFYLKTKKDRMGHIL
ncbi:MAG: GTP cyclohydrolase II [Lentisphaeria bacterium]|nr:GTP cyclohydrolase II [Lentisphaeria bacterium]